MNDFLFLQCDQNVNHLKYEVADLGFCECFPSFDHVIEGLREGRVTPRGQSSMMM